MRSIRLCNRLQILAFRKFKEAVKRFGFNHGGGTGQMKIMNISMKQKWWAGALALIMAVALTACGGSSSSQTAPANTNTGGSGGAAASPSATTETKQEPKAQETKKPSYPEKPVTMVVPNSPGGSWDIAGRAIVKVLQEEGLIDFQMPVENVPGGSGAVYLAEAVTKRSNNDYEIFVNSPSILLNNLRNEAPSPFGYKDTTPLAQLFRDYGVIAVRADSPFNDLKSLFDKMRENPGPIRSAAVPLPARSGT
jgi:putative tricarboxylic transport membrane protein